MDQKSRVDGAILGLAIGDALGAPVEFKKRHSYPLITKYESGGEFNLSAGQWTDDTTLALCLLESLITKKRFDLKDQMNNFLKWWQFGFLSSTGFCFDIGNTTKKSLERFKLNGIVMAGMPDDPATNGAIMRLAPIPIFLKDSLAKSIEHSVLQTKTTHAPIECVEASMILAYVIHFALLGKSKLEILKFTHFEYKLTSPQIKNILQGSFKTKSSEEVSGRGLAETTLESALYAFYHFDNFIDGLIFVVNLGDDTDTVGAVYGQIAGAYYGVDNIPSYYIENLFDKNKIQNKIDQLWELINV